MSCYVYVLEFAHLGYYIGCSSNVYRRITQHAHRIAAHSSVSGYLGCFAFNTRVEALEAELLLQRLGDLGVLTETLDILSEYLIRDWPPPDFRLKTPCRRKM